MKEPLEALLVQLSLVVLWDLLVRVQMKVLLEAQLARLYLVYLGFLLHPEFPEFLADPVDLLHLEFLVHPVNR